MKSLKEFFRRAKKAAPPEAPIAEAPVAETLAPVAEAAVLPPPPLTCFELGCQGDAEALRVALQKDIDVVLAREKLDTGSEALPQRGDEYRRRNEARDAMEPAVKEARKNIADVFKGVLHANSEGRAENLRVFLSSYAPALKQMKNSKLNSYNLCHDNLYSLVAESAAQIETIKWFAAAVGEAQRQELMDSVLQIACDKKDLKLIEASLDAGADPYADSSRAVHIAVYRGDMMDTLRMMYKRGIDLSRNASHWHVERKVAMVDAQKHFLLEDKLDGFRQQITDLTAEVNRLKAEVFKQPEGSTPTPPPADAPKV